MNQAISFTTPITIQGLAMPELSPEMMYLLSTDVAQHGKHAILRQLARLFEIDLEELLHPALEERPAVTMHYEPYDQEWEFLGDREDNAALQAAYQLAQTTHTGDADDEISEQMLTDGWSMTKEIKEPVDKMLHFIKTYPFFWRAIKYQPTQLDLKPYFETKHAALSGAEEVITAFVLDVQEIALFLQRLEEYKLLWFAKHELTPE